METRTSPRWPLAVALVAVLVHLGTLWNGFTLDDVPLVEQNPSIVSLARLPHLFVESYWQSTGESHGLYRPLTLASFAINRALAGAGPFGFHLVNVLLHAAAAALAWYAIRDAGTRYGTAFLGALLFAVHPLHAEAVAGIAGRAELLAAVFVLAAWRLHRRGRTAWAALCYLAAILSKEGAVLAPLLFWADDALRDRGTAWRRLAPRFGAYAGALAAMLAARRLVLGAAQGAVDAIQLDNPAAAAGTATRALTALWVQAKYALLCVWPHPLSSDYSFDAIPVVQSWADPRALAGVLGVGAVVTLAAWGWARSKTAALAALAWILFFLPAANLLFPTGTIMAERLAYLPLLGFCLAVGHAGAEAAARGRPRPVIAAAAVVIVACGAATWVRDAAWKDNLTLATTDVVHTPRSAKLQAGAGIFLAAAGRKTEAEVHLRRAIEIYPPYAQMHYNLAVLLAERGARDEAILHLRRAIELAPGNPKPRQFVERLR